MATHLVEVDPHDTGLGKERGNGYELVHDGGARLEGVRVAVNRVDRSDGVDDPPFQLGRRGDRCLLLCPDLVLVALWCVVVRCGVLGARAGGRQQQLVVSSRVF